MTDSYLSRVKTIAALTVPTIFGSVVIFLQEIINLIFVGHLHDASKIAAIGIGNALINILGVAFITGMNGASNTYIS